jgi:hypothetical protein
VVNVPIPEGYLKPEGTLEINQEGTYNVTEYSNANFNVQKEQTSVVPKEEKQILTPSENKFFDKVTVEPIPSQYIVPSGSIDIVNTNEVDVTKYEKAQIIDENLKAENIAEGVEVLGITGTHAGGGIDTSDGTITPDKVLKDEIGYAKDERIVGAIETYDYSTSNEVKPEIDRLFNTISDYENTIIAGSSMGGIFAYYMGVKYSNIFKLAICFSPAFCLYEENAFKQNLIKLNKLNNKFYLLVGDIEYENQFVSLTKYTYEFMKGSGFNVYYKHDLEGIHHESFWNKYFNDALDYLDK